MLHVLRAGQARVGKQGCSTSPRFPSVSESVRNSVPSSQPDRQTLRYRPRIFDQSGGWIRDRVTDKFSREAGLRVAISPKYHATSQCDVTCTEASEVMKVNTSVSYYKINVGCVMISSIHIAVLVYYILSVKYFQ